MAQTQKTNAAMTSKLKKYSGVIEEKAQTAARDVGFQQIPGGIVSGIGEVIKCEIVEYGPDTTAKKADGTTAKGELYWRLEFVILSPEQIIIPPGIVGWDAGPRVVKNQRASIMINLFDTRDGKGQVTTGERHVQDMVNMMQLLTSEEFMADADWENMLSKCEELTRFVETDETGPEGEPRRRGPYTKFSTTWGKPKTGPDGKPTGEAQKGYVNCYGSKGVPHDFRPDDSALAEDGSDDAEVVEPAAPPKPAHKKAAVTAKSNGSVAAPAKAPVKAAAPAKVESASSDRGVFDEFGDLDSLAVAADVKKDKNARLKIQEAYRSLGINDDDMKSVPTWKGVVDIIKARGAADADVEDKATALDEDFVPKVGQTVIYRPTDKDDEPTGEEITCETLKVNEKFGWANLKNLEDGETVYEKVDMTQLAPAD